MENGESKFIPVQAETSRGTLITNYDEVDALRQKTYRSFGNLINLNDPFRRTVTPSRIFFLLNRESGDLTRSREDAKRLARGFENSVLERSSRLFMSSPESSFSSHKKGSLDPFRTLTSWTIQTCLREAVPRRMPTRPGAKRTGTILALRSEDLVSGANDVRPRCRGCLTSLLRRWIADKSAPESD